MLDIRLIREKPDFVRERLATRGGGDDAKIAEVLRVDAERRKIETQLQRLQADRNRLSKEIGAKRSRSEPSEDLEAQVRKIGDEIVDLTQRASTFDEEQRHLLLEIANLPHESVPVGKDPSANRVARSWGEKPQLSEPADHVALGAKLKLFDLEWAAKLSGSDFICFTGAGAKLERALINFMIDLHTREHGYTEISPPFLVRRDCMVGTTQLPKFEADMYGLEENQLFLAPTAEVQLTNLHREEILERQYVQERIARAAMELFAAACVLSRWDAELEIAGTDAKNNGSPHGAAELFLRGSVRRARVHVGQVDTDAVVPDVADEHEGNGNDQDRTDEVVQVLGQDREPRE